MKKNERRPSSNHRIEAYLRTDEQTGRDHAYCAKCEKPVQQTGRGNGWTHTA